MMTKPLRAIARLALLALATAAGRPADDRPNVIVILADDLGYGDVGAYGSKRARTPHIDALAASGVRFAAGYVTHPVCAPSRAALMTGRYQQRFGFEFNPVGRDASSGMALSETTIAQIMQSAGYRTGLVGKWHLGSANGYHPNDRGFREYFGMLAGVSSYIVKPRPGDQFHTPPGSENALRVTAATGNEPSVSIATEVETLRKATPIYRNRQIVHEPRYITDAFTDEAVDFVGRNRDRPFFLFVSYNAPHTPLQVTRKYYDRFPQIADKGTRVYTAMVSALDDGVGRIMAKLRAERLERRTLVVFLSDNGCASYVLGACSNAPLAGFKGTQLEGGVRIPFVMALPGRIPPRQVEVRQVSSLDILPTAARLARAALPHLRVYDGVDLLPFVTGQDKSAPHQALYWRAGVTRAIRDGDRKLWIANRAPASARSRLGGLEAPVADGIEAVVGAEGQHVMLYDLKTDPGERNNLASQRPDDVADLERQLSVWNSTLVRPQWTSRRQSVEMHDGVILQLFQ